jgi:DNA repair photolyase
MPFAGEKYGQAAIFPDRLTLRPVLPVLDEQSDIRYFGTRAKTVINRPEATGMEFWSINPYVGCALGCAYCYARFAHGYAFERAAVANPDRIDINRDYRGMVPWLAFERRILVKENAAEALRKTLRQGSPRHAGLISGEPIMIGSATDPYQPAERRFRITRSILEVLAEHPGLNVRIISKSPLITRDVDVMRRILRHSSIKVTISLISVDRELARRIEPRAPTPEARLRAIRRLSDAGVEVSVNVMPVLPGITDGTEQLDALVKEIAGSGAKRIHAGTLHLRASSRARYFPFIAAEFPHLLTRYQATYGHAAFAGDGYRAGLERVMARLCARHGIALGHYGGDEDEATALPALEQLELPLARSVDGDELDLEDQGRVGGNVVLGAPAVGEVGRQDDGAAAAGTHAGERVAPAAEDAGVEEDVHRRRLSLDDGAAGE